MNTDGVGVPELVVVVVVVDPVGEQATVCEHLVDVPVEYVLPVSSTS
jgi:hypothetical protein